MKQGGWRKSSRSGGDGGNCVEARVTPWRKSSRSGADGTADNCVEARGALDNFQVRDSKLGDDSPIFDLQASDFTGLLRAADRA